MFALAPSGLVAVGDSRFVIADIFEAAVPASLFTMVFVVLVSLARLGSRGLETVWRIGGTNTSSPRTATKNSFCDLVLRASEARRAERRLIVEAACTLLEQGGLDELTIRAVLKKTRLSRRAFYERFGGKDELMLAVLEHTLRLAAQHFQRQIAHLDWSGSSTPSRSARARLDRRAVRPPGGAAQR